MNAQLVRMTVMQMRGARITQARLLVHARQALKETEKLVKVMTIDIKILSACLQVGREILALGLPYQEGRR